MTLSKILTPEQCEALEAFQKAAKMPMPAVARIVKQIKGMPKP